MSATGIFFNVNGKDVKEKNVDPELTLAYYLRNNLGLRGTKLGCEEGVCGSCTVVLGTWDDLECKAVYRAVNACLVPLFHVHKTFVLTVEGVGTRDNIHPIQERMAKGHALQCGFCSPGFVMSAYALLRTHPNPSIEQINSAIRANLCRCTGYRPILESLYSFSPENSGCCGGNKIGGGCCKTIKSSNDDDEGYEKKLLSFDDFPKYDATQEIIFPPSLRTYVDDENPVILLGSRIELALPKNLEQFKSGKQDRNVISSGLITRFIASRNPKEYSQKWITTKYVKEFNLINITPDDVTIGSAVSIQKFAETLSSSLNAYTGEEIHKFIQNFSSPQIANFATWTGAIISGAKSSISVSDILLLFHVLDAKITLLTEAGELIKVEIKQLVEQKLFESNTIVNAVFSRSENRRLFCLKLGETSENDSTNFNFAALVGKSSRIFVGLGGQPLRLSHLETLIDFGVPSDINDFYKASGLEKTNSLTIAFTRFLGFLENSLNDDDSDRISYLQYFKPTVKESVGRPIANYVNELAITGEALYVNDIPAHNAVHLGFVLSSVPHAEIVSIDASEALKLNGVAGFFGVSDLPGCNTPGLQLSNVSFPDDATIFAHKKVESVGQVIAVIAADDVVLARRAAKLVKVEYKELKALVDFKEARDAGSLLGDVQHYGKNEELVKECLENSAKVLEGEIHLGGQEHYYLETQSTLVIPGESDELVVNCSTQHPSFTQLMVAEAMQIPAHKVIVKTRRLGGAFGGKVNSVSWISCMCAVVARKLRRPVYGFLSRGDDLAITGKRHEVYAKYRVGITSEGKVNGIHYQAWLNGGWSKDHSEGVTMVMGLFVDDVYNMGTVRFDGYPVKTNSNSSTAFRGYGHPQTKLLNEGVMRRIAHEVNKDVEEIKRINFAVEGDKRFLGGEILNDGLAECWDNCKNWSEFERRKHIIEEFNRDSTVIKRGIAMSSVRFRLPHPGAHGIASLLINLDGSVQLSIGGTEMGQGLNQKMLQVCSEALKRPIETITIVDTSTDKVTNASETGGSQNTDTNGLAVLECCKRILSRLQPIIDKNKGDWNKSIREAYAARVPLQCIEYGIFERSKLNNKDPEYNTTGACAVEVEVDTLTGYNKVIRVDIVMDVGESINPAIDIGQIEGAFMQGYGLVTCEKITFNKATGHLDQSSSGKYKIPRASDVPKDFRVKLLGINKANGALVYSSKGIGEPPLVMSCGAVHSAIMKCVESWRKEHGVDEFVDTISPMSADKIQQLCSK